MREGWADCKLEELLKLKNGYAFKSSKYLSQGIPVIRIGDIKDWLVDETNAKCIEENEEYDGYIVERGDILIAMSGATTGKFGIYESNNKAYQNQRVGNLKPHSDKYLHKKYIYLLLYSLKAKIEKDAYGGAQPNISAGKIEAYEIGLAPLPEQRAIVAKIEQLFSELDNGIKNFKKAQEQLKIYRQAVLKKAFEGELTKEWRSEKTVNLKEWQLKSLSEITDKITDGEHFRPPTQEDGIYFLSAKDVRDNGVNFSSPLYISEETAKKALKRCNPERDDILIVSRGATVGRMCIVKTDEVFCLLGSVILLKVNRSISSLYLTYVLKSPIGNQNLIALSGSTAQQAIYLRDIKKVEIPLPSLEEQHQIVQEIESRLSVCDKLEESIQESLIKAEALRQSILKQAFEGKLLSEEELAATKKEVDWEPAEVLLRRIEKEKNLVAKKKK